MNFQFPYFSFRVIREIKWKNTQPHENALWINHEIEWSTLQIHTLCGTQEYFKQIVTVPKHI